MKKLIAGLVIVLSLGVAVPASARTPSYVEGELFRSCYVRLILSGSYAPAQAERICTRVVYGH